MDSKSRLYLDVNRIHRELKLMSYSTLGHPTNGLVKEAVVKLEKIKEILKKEIENN